MGRIDRINQAIKEEISRIIHLEVKDPRLQFVTVTHVEVTRDLQHAKVYFSVLGNTAKVKEAQQGLDSARGFIRKLVGERVRLRYTPQIDFIFDETIEYSARIEETIERIKNEFEGDSRGD